MYYCSFEWFALNYATWRVQCQMALIRDGLWEIVSEAEQATRPDTQANIVI